jgi:formamidopyrimidine-DNA glycosylase
VAVPELPEVRALAERLEAALGGRRLTAVDVPGFSGLKTVTPTPDALMGATLDAVTSRGKYVVLGFGDAGRALVHLGNAGRVDVELPVKATRPRGSLVRLTFDGDGLLVREHGRERRAGLWVLAANDDGPLAALGPEPFDDGFAELVADGTDRRHLHTMLRDQRTVAGVGRGYADDVLNRAGLSPFATLDALDAAAREGLLDSTRGVLAEALDRERDRRGGLAEASLGDRFLVHRRAGSPCPRCARQLERVSYESYEIVYCPSCQTKGKVLADRRLSRLLR